MEYRADKNLIAACGLYCGTCRAFVKAKCPGCRENRKAEKWCKLRSCVQAQGYISCAECREYGGTAPKTLRECGKFNNFMGKVFGLIFRSDRFGCIDRIREAGPETFAEEMAGTGCYNRPVVRKRE
ncbi:MAG: DUF3795 domain-containing protein [Rikenellaceae bacterium]|nr:DUF3795 domain-containing protein [Rikenellaceae bacterium]